MCRCSFICICFLLRFVTGVQQKCVVYILKWGCEQTTFFTKDSLTKKKLQAANKNFLSKKGKQITLQ